MIYNADHAPDGEYWLSLDEDERITLVGASHRPLPKNHPAVPNLQLHASFHVIVENQIAMDDPKPVRSAMTRLQSQGLSRHEAIHAIAWVLAMRLHDSSRKGKASSNEDYEGRIARLTAREWLDQAADEEETEDEIKGREMRRQALERRIKRRR